MSAATLTPTPPAVPTLAGLDRGDLAERSTQVADAIDARSASLGVCLDSSAWWEAREKFARASDLARRAAEAVREAMEAEFEQANEVSPCQREF